MKTNKESSGSRIRQSIRNVKNKVKEKIHVRKPSDGGQRKTEKVKEKLHKIKDKVKNKLKKKEKDPYKPKM